MKSQKSPSIKNSKKRSQKWLEPELKKKSALISWIPKLKMLTLTILQISWLVFINPGSFHTVSAAAPLTCDDLANPEKQSGKIITIIEEQIGQPTKPSDEKGLDQILNCFRENTCTKLDKKMEGETSGNNKPTCVAKYVGSCNTLREGDAKVVTCQRIQAYISDSGANLLYIYVGNIYRWAAGIIGIITVFYIVVGGVEIATAGGDAGKIDSAKERIVRSIMGLVILFLSGLFLYSINPNFFTR